MLKFGALHSILQVSNSHADLVTMTAWFIKAEGKIMPHGENIICSLCGGVLICQKDLKLASTA